MMTIRDRHLHRVLKVAWQPAHNPDLTGEPADVLTPRPSALRVTTSAPQNYS